MNDYYKNNVTPKTFRERGNELYKQEHYYDTLVKYNQSLCFSIVGSEDMALAYGNRSAIYFKLGHYDKVISNIQKALKSSYPEVKKQKLLNRKKEAEKLLDTMPLKDDKVEIENCLKLSYNPNPKYPSFADCIELRSNEKYGRYLITNRDLKVGDIIAIEDFFYYSINNKGKQVKELTNYQICSFCHRSNLLDLQPCRRCAFTMYCSDNCCDDDLHQLHFTDCSLMPFYIRNPSYYTTIRSFFMALSICNSIEELKKVIEEAESYEKPVTVFDFDFSKMTELGKKKKLIQIMYCGHRKKAVRSIVDIIDAVLTNYPLTKTIYEYNKEFIIKFITRVHEVQAANGYEFGTLLPKIEAPNLFPSIGDCMSPGLSLLNHSCASNIAKLNFGKKSFAVVTRKVKQGELLSFCYKSNFIQKSRTERRKYLLKYYDFECDCIACEKNLSSLEIPANMDVMLKTLRFPKIFQKLSEDNKRTPDLAKKYLNEHLSILNEFTRSDSYTKHYQNLINPMNICFTSLASYLYEPGQVRIP